MNQTISGSRSILRNADVGHMLELREKLAVSDLEIANLKRAIQDVREAKGRFNTQTACEKMFKMID